VLLLAMKTGWSRAEILSLPADEFNHYLEVLIKAKSDGQ
jgi:hypothetical protein